ncbi:hypothetical protein [Parafrankia sp. CH37]|nr:hypothetical protein [Parafrankia sp. CH37]
MRTVQIHAERCRAVVEYVRDGGFPQIEHRHPSMLTWDRRAISSGFGQGM